MTGKSSQPNRHDVLTRDDGGFWFDTWGNPNNFIQVLFVPKAFKQVLWPLMGQREWKALKSQGRVVISKPAISSQGDTSFYCLNTRVHLIFFLNFFCTFKVVQNAYFHTVISFPIASLKQQTCSCLLDGHPCLGDRNASLGDRRACCRKFSVVK